MTGQIAIGEDTGLFYESMRKAVEAGLLSEYAEGDFFGWYEVFTDALAETAKKEQWPVLFQRFIGNSPRTRPKLLPSSEKRLEKLCYSIKEVAVVIGISRTEASNLVHSEGFPAFHHGRRILVAREQLAEWVSKRAEQGLGDRYIRKEK